MGASAGEVVSTYSVASSGVLTPIGSATITAAPTRVAFSPGGGTLATTENPDAAGLYLKSIGSAGALSPVQSLETPEPVRNIAVGASGLIVAEGIFRALAVFVTSSASSGTSWVGALGGNGYDLAGWDGESDVSYLPDASLSLVQGSRVVWAANTSDGRALTGPDGLTRTAAGYYSPTQLQVKLTFHAAYTGNLGLYAVNWGAGVAKEAESITEFQQQQLRSRSATTSTHGQSRFQRRPMGGLPGQRAGGRGALRSRPPLMEAAAPCSRASSSVMRERLPMRCRSRECSSGDVERRARLRGL